MFTGIIEGLGNIVGIDKTGAGTHILVESKLAASDSKIGDSISIDGACLTVSDKKGNILVFDVSTETLRRTSLEKIEIGDRVNIERSLKAGSRLGGHFVTGHIDGVGKIISKRPQGEFTEIEIEIDEALMKYLVEKGPIAVDGISLTINMVKLRVFSCCVIPHTLASTTLKKKDAGDYVNIEVDMLAKYIERLTTKSQGHVTKPPNITSSLLKEHGFI